MKVIKKRGKSLNREVKVILPEPLINRLKEVHENDGASFSELVRTAIRTYLALQVAYRVEEGVNDES